MDTIRDIIEKKASLGDPSEIADPVTPSGGTDHHRGADKTAGETSPIMQGNSPKTRIGLISGILSATKGMDTDELKGLHAKVKASGRNGPGEGTIMQGSSRLKEALVRILETIDEDDIDVDDLATIVSYLEEEEIEPEGSITSDDVDTEKIEEFLVNNELGPEAIEKIKTIFEAEVVDKVNDHLSVIEEDSEAEVEAEVESVSDSMVEAVDSYLNYVVEKWIEDNAVELEGNIRAEIAESFLQSLAGVFAEHYVEVPEEKIDIVDALAGKNTEIEEELDDLIRDNVSLINENEALKRQAVLSDATEGMTAPDAERLIELAEGVAYESDETFANKVETIKESYFQDDDRDEMEMGLQSLVEDEDEDAALLVETGAVEDEGPSYKYPAIQSYVNAMRRTARRQTIK